MCDHIFSRLLCKTSYSLLECTDSIRTRCPAWCSSTNPQPLIPSGRLEFIFPVDSTDVGGELSLLPAAASAAAKICASLLSATTCCSGSACSATTPPFRGSHQTLSYPLKQSRSADRLHQKLHVGSPPPLRISISHSSPSNRHSPCKRRRPHSI